MSHQLFLIVGEYGVFIVFVNVLLDQLGIPIPAVPTLLVAGALAVGGRIPLIPLFVWAVVACLAADAAWYCIGRRYGIRVLKVLCRISLEPDSCVSQTQTRFERWGGVGSLMFAKFIPGLAIIAPPLAGAMRIGWPRFLGLSTVGAMLWVGSALVAGMLFSTQIESLLLRLDHIGNLVGVLFVAAFAAYVGFKAWERERFYRSLRMARIDVAELYDLMEAGAEPVIVDVRSNAARALEPGWIPGSRHLPIDDIASHIKDLPRDRDIILYCACPSEATAAKVAKLLMSHGFTKVRPLQGGLDAWVAAGYAVVGVSKPQ